MANITASDVNKLRQVSGAGMMDCKNALVEANGDFDAAIDILRKRGQKLASKRSDRSANEGYIAVKTAADNKTVVALSLNCETDFVAKNQDFIDFANALAELALANKPASIEELNALTLNGLTVADNMTDMIGKIGEKIEVAVLEVVSAESAVAYVHQGNRLVAVLGLNILGYETVGREVAMQVAAMNPVAIDKDDVDQSVIEKELEIAKDLIRQEGKPEEMVEKIAQGKLNKFFKENTLLNQQFVRDNSKTIQQYLTETCKDLTVKVMKRIQIGE